MSGLSHLCLAHCNDPRRFTFPRTQLPPSLVAVAFDGGDAFGINGPEPSLFAEIGL